MANRSSAAVEMIGGATMNFSAIGSHSAGMVGRIIVPVLFTGFWLAWTALSCAATPVQLAQGAANVLEMGKAALGLGETTPEDRERTGIANGVPFLVHFRETIRRVISIAKCDFAGLSRTCPMELPHAPHLSPARSG